MYTFSPSLSIIALSEGISGLLVRFIIQHKIEKKQQRIKFSEYGTTINSTPNAYKNMFDHFSFDIDM